jgi:FG-GAP-like repeat
MADLNRDGKVDLLWRHDPTGQMGYWIMDGNDRVGTGSPLLNESNGQVFCSSGWRPVGTGDFNGDGQPRAASSE